jgi:hypothetical protein
MQNITILHDLRFQFIIYNNESSIYRSNIEGNDNFWIIGKGIRTFESELNVNVVKVECGLEKLILSDNVWISNDNITRESLDWNARRDPSGVADIVKEAGLLS